MKSNTKALGSYRDGTTPISFIGYLGIIMLLVTTVINTSPYGASLSWVLIPCIFIVIGKFFFIRRITVVGIEYIYLFLFWFVFLISTIKSSVVSIERDLLTFFIFCVVCFCATSCEYNCKQIKNLITVYILVSLFVEINILYNWITHNYFSEWFGRVSFSFGGVYRDPNYVMAFVVPAVAFAFIKVIHEKKMFLKLLYVLFLVISIIAILGTGSRTPMLTIAVFLFIFFLISADISIKKKVAIVIITILLLVMAIYLIKNIYSEQAIERLLKSGVDDSRLKLWKYSFSIFKKYPVLGGGMAAASTASQVGGGHDSHNVYLDILCNSGIVGTVLFLLFLKRACLKTTSQNMAFIYSMFVTFMLPMMFINGFNTATFYTPIIMLSILSKYCRQKDSYYLDLLVDKN